MRLSVEHLSHYTFDAPLQYGLQRLRLTPKSRAGQTILRWSIEVDGGAVEARFDDQHNNHVMLISLAEGVGEIKVRAEGEVETADSGGVIGRHGGFAPLWYFHRETPLTKPGPLLRKLARDIAGPEAIDLPQLHALMAAIVEQAEYKVGATHVEVTAEDALEAGAGVCQDHAHIFIAVARLLGRPARYVSGYLMMNDRIEQEATHAWAEVHVDDLGWVGFDVSNGISPDARYIRVATGLDYKDAAPISGLTFGRAAEKLHVNLRVEQ